MKSNQKTSLFIVDWLTFKLDINFNNYQSQDNYIYLNDSIVIEVTGKQSKEFCNIDNLMYEGIAIATIAYNPKSLLNVSKQYVQVKIHNEHLYSGLWLMFYLELNKINNNIKVNRIDIANDSIITKHKDPISILRRFIYNNSEGNKYFIKKRGKSNVSQSYNTFYVGNRNSRKYFKIYNKTKELQHSKKEYINDYFKLNNLNYNNIVRQELTLTGNYATDLDITQLTDINYLASVFKSHAKNYYEFYKVVKNNKKNIELVNYNNIQSIYNKPIRVNNKEIIMFNRVKRTLKAEIFKLFFAYSEGKLNDIQTIRNNIIHSIKEYDLTNHLKLMFVDYKEDFIKLYLNAVCYNDAKFYLNDVTYNSIISNTIILPVDYKQYLNNIYTSKQMLSVIRNKNEIIVID